MLKRACSVRGKIVYVQTASDTTANQGTVDRACHGLRQSAQLRKAVVQLAKAEAEVSEWRPNAFVQYVRVAANGKVPPCTLQHYGADAGQGQEVLHCMMHVITQGGTERVEVLRVAEL